MFKNVIVLTDLDLFRTPKTVSNNFTINDVVWTDFKIKREDFYKAERVLYINEVGELKVLKDRDIEFEREINIINRIKYFKNNYKNT